MRRILAALCSLALLVVFAAPAHAQLGGLKKKVADKVTGKKPDTTAVGAASGSKPKCDKSSIVITSDVVDRYLKGLAARDAELRRIAKEPGPAGAYYNAYFRRQEVERRKEAFDLRRGNDWERYKVIYPKMIKGDQAALRQNQALQDSLEPSKVEVPELSWETQQANNERLDSVAMNAAGFSACDWGGTGLGERFPTLVRELVNSPDGKDVHGAGTPQEVAAVKARLEDFKNAFGYSSRRREFTAAEKAHIQEEDEKLQEASMMTGDAYSDCMTKFNREFLKKHQAEIEKMQKDQDQAGVMRLGLLQAKEGNEACGKYSKNKSDDDDE